MTGNSLLIISLIAFSKIAFADGVADPADCSVSNNTLFLESALSPVYNATCDLPVNMPVVINRDWVSSPTSVEQRYRLTRTSDKNYLAEVRLDFLSADESQRADMQKKSTTCLAAAAPFFKGPNGEALTIELTQDKLVPRSEIAIQPAKFRDNSHAYAIDTDCSTIVHETLHLLGLVDEYTEYADGYSVDPKTGVLKEVSSGATSLKYDCRATGPRDSIMVDQVKAFGELKSSYLTELKICKCQMKVSACESYALDYSFLRRNGCPKGFIPAVNQSEDQSPSPATEIGGDVFGNGDFAYIQIPKVTLKPPKKDTILYPAQFRMITAPDCLLKNTLYSVCAENAYTTSKKNHGDGCKNDLPVECQAQSADWLK